MNIHQYDHAMEDVTDVTSQQSSKDAKEPTVSEHTRYVLDEIGKIFDRYLYFPTPAARDATVLWVAHAWVLPHLDTSPRLAVLSSEPGSGKTRVLELLEMLTPNPLMAVNITPSVLWRTIDSARIATMLVDEADTLFGRKGSGSARIELRSILNSGYRRGATVPRPKGGHDGGVAHFNVFAPVALAGLGNLPETIMSRAISIKMKKPPRNLQLESFRLRQVQIETAALQWELSAWADEAGKYIELAYPDMPVRDREAEVWEPLFAVAEVAGGEWPQRVLDSCTAFTKDESDKTDPKAELLRAVKRVVGNRSVIFTNDLIRELWESDGPGGWEIETLSPRSLARVLAQHGVVPQTVRDGNQTAKGYYGHDLASIEV